MYSDPASRIPRRHANGWMTVLALGLLVLAGCQPTLESGYEPRPLNASEADRRSYYAPAFSPEAHPEKEAPAFNLAP